MTTSRRIFLQQLSTATVVWAGQNRGPSPGSPRLQALKEFRGAFLRAVSADGTDMCAVVAPDGVETWTYRDGQWSQENARTVPQDASLCVVELGSWKMIYSTKLEAAPFIASFFRDSHELYVTALFQEGGKGGDQQLVIDLRAGTIKDEQIRSGLFQTTRDQQLLTMTGQLGKGSVLKLVELPDYHEVAHASVEVAPSGRFGTDQVVSSQGNSFVYGMDDMLVCRRTDDLAASCGRAD